MSYISTYLSLCYLEVDLESLLQQHTSVSFIQIIEWLQLDLIYF